MKNRFDFKQFSICQDQCSMKVGTDGVLLGAWADGGRRILDIGTGTGIIALMMAQRFPDAAIDAIEIDHDACRQAAGNIAATPFADRIRIHECPIQHFQTTMRYDAIVSNPPYFINSMKNPDKKRLPPDTPIHFLHATYSWLQKKCSMKTAFLASLSLQIAPNSLLPRVVS